MADQLKKAGASLSGELATESNFESLILWNLNGTSAKVKPGQPGYLVNVEAATYENYLGGL